MGTGEGEQVWGTEEVNTSKRVSVCLCQSPMSETARELAGRMGPELPASVSRPLIHSFFQPITLIELAGPGRCSGHKEVSPSINSQPNSLLIGGKGVGGGEAGLDRIRAPHSQAGAKQS